MMFEKTDDFSILNLYYSSFWSIFAYTNDAFDKIIEIIKRDSAEGYPYLLNKAHNDVVITNNHVDELLKISRIYETTNREQLKKW